MYVFAALVLVSCAAWVNSQLPPNHGQHPHLPLTGLQQNGCHTNSDCQSTECCASSSLHGQFCHPYQNVSHPCHLPGHHSIVYHCGCAPGLTCEQIHLDPNHNLNSIQSAILQAEQLLAKGGLGMCAATST